MDRLTVVLAIPDLDRAVTHELGKRPLDHSAYIPGLPTNRGRKWPTAAHADSSTSGCPRWSKPVSAGDRGAPGRIRTCGTRFRKPLLYPLSYEGSSRARAAPPTGVSGTRLAGRHRKVAGTLPRVNS